MRIQILKKIVFSLIIASFIFFGINYLKNRTLKPSSPPSEISLPSFEEQKWSNPTNISHAPGLVSIVEKGEKGIYPKSPILAADNSNIIHTVWIEEEKEGVKETLEGKVWDWRFNVKKYLSYSFKKNGVWSEPIRLFEFDETQPYYVTVEKEFTKLEFVSDKNGALHLIWSLTETKYEPVKEGEMPAVRMATSVKEEGIFYSQKPKNGKWSKPEAIFNPQEKHQKEISQILLAVDSNCRPHILCLLPDDNIYHLTKDGNNNWFSSLQVFQTRNEIKARPKYLWLTIDNKDTWHFIWSERENKMYYTIKPKGEDWQTPIEISQGKELHLGSFFTVAFDKQSSLHFAWRDNRSTGPNPIIYALKSKNETFSELVYFTEDSHDFSGYEWGVRLVLDNNIPHIIWIGDEYKIMYATKLKEGNWSEPITISNDLGRINREPYLLGGEEVLHLVFMSGEWSYGNIFYSFKPLK